MTDTFKGMYIDTVLFPCGVGGVASHLLSKPVGSLSQGNFGGRSLKGPRLTTTGRHTNTRAIQCSFFNFTC